MPRTFFTLINIAMEPEKIKIYFILLRLKSYLVSLVDNPDECAKDFVYTEEFLNRRYPERMDEIIDLLREHDIHSDCDIAFNQNIQAKFKAMIDKEVLKIDLETMLNNLEIGSNELLKREKEIDKIKLAREEKIKSILASLFRLSKIWVTHQNLQSEIDNYSKLDEEEILRPEEMDELNRLGIDSSLSFDVISKMTIKYLDELGDFYFRFGGDINLNSFLNDLQKLKTDVQNKYDNLFKEHGLDPGELNKE